MSERATIVAMLFIFSLAAFGASFVGLRQAEQLAQAQIDNQTLVQLLDRERTYSDSLLAALYESMALTRTCIEGRD